MSWHKFFFSLEEGAALPAQVEASSTAGKTDDTQCGKRLGVNPNRLNDTKISRVKFFFFLSSVTG